MKSPTPRTLQTRVDHASPAIGQDDRLARFQPEGPEMARLFLIEKNDLSRVAIDQFRMIERERPSFLLFHHARNLRPAFPVAPDSRLAVRRLSPFPDRFEPALCSGYEPFTVDGRRVFDEVPTYRTD